MMDRDRFFQAALRHTTFNRNDVQIFAPSLPERLKHEPGRRYILHDDVLWHVERIEGDSVFCREATNQELADIQEGMREQA